MYDVIYLEKGRNSTVLAEGLPAETAISFAREEARRRRVGRMFGAGSETTHLGEMVLIVESEREAVAAA